MYSNGHCSTCEVESQCGYEYKPCDCCGQRKFKPKPEQPKQEEPKGGLAEAVKKARGGDAPIPFRGFA